MSRLGALLISAGIALASLAASWTAGASELIDRPIFTPDRQFVVQAPQSATRIDDDSLPIQLWIFDRAIQSCGLEPDRIRGQIAQILDENSAIWSKLDRLFPKSLDQTSSRKITVLIDDFSQFAGRKPIFTSYYIPLNQPVIGLDCSSLARSYWLPSLAHELTHALLDGSEVESGREEGLAQLMESDAGGVQPELTLKHLESASEIPSILETRRPLPSRESYAIQYLFARYIKQVFGGWDILRAMIHSANACERETDFLTLIACRGQVFLAGQKSSLSAASIDRTAILSADKMTRAGLLRYFYVALTMNNRYDSKYSIQGWNGLKNLSTQPLRSTLQTGQAMAFTSRPDIERINPKIEIYRILLDANDTFRILPREQIDHPPQGFQAKRDYYLAINLAERTEPFFTQ